MVIQNTPFKRYKNSANRMESKNEVFLSWGAACFHTKYNFLLPDNGFFVAALLDFLTLVKWSGGNKV